MRDLILGKVAEAAETLGMSRERVMTKSASDNLTLPRPRLELDFLPETYTRTGRLHGGPGLPGLSPGPGRMRYKKELYQVSLPVAAQALADDEEWLKDFSWRLLSVLPRSFNDKRGNYVRLAAAMGQWEGYEARRVGEAVIEPIVRRGYLLHLTAIWRICQEELVTYVGKVDLNVHTGGNNG